MHDQKAESGRVRAGLSCDSPPAEKLEEHTWFSSLRDFPSKNKNRITDRYFSFSIFLKSADTSHSTRSQNKTRKNAIVEYYQYYQIPATQLNGDVQAAKRDYRR